MLNRVLCLCLLLLQVFRTFLDLRTLRPTVSSSSASISPTSSSNSISTTRSSLWKKYNTLCIQKQCACYGYIRVVMWYYTIQFHPSLIMTQFVLVFRVDREIFCNQCQISCCIHQHTKLVWTQIWSSTGSQARCNYCPYYYIPGILSTELHTFACWDVCIRRLSFYLSYGQSFLWFFLALTCSEVWVCRSTFRGKRFESGYFYSPMAVYTPGVQGMYR